MKYREIIRAFEYYIEQEKKRMTEKAMFFDMHSDEFLARIEWDIDISPKRIMEEVERVSSYYEGYNKRGLEPFL